LIISRAPISLRRKQITGWKEISDGLAISAVTTAPTKATNKDWDKAYWRRVGDTLEYRGTYRHSDNEDAAAGVGTYLFTLPLGLSVDSTKMRVSTTSCNSIAGYAVAKGDDTAEDAGVAICQMYDSENLVIAQMEPNLFAGPALVGGLYHGMGNSSVVYHLHAWVPISGWGVRKI
jgi:hypothetical protein